MPDGPLKLYRDKLSDGDLKPDPAQALAVEKLQLLHHALKDFEPKTVGHTGWKARFGLARRREDPPQGIYFWGGVGRGKSMLMDLFYRCAPVKRKRRVHFHAFMQDVHARLNRLRNWRAFDGDPITKVAGDIADEAWLLCFDELQVLDITDAMILGRLFESLFKHDVVIVTTSNRPPADLYKDGLQRDRFLPFIDLIGKKLDVMQLDGGTDYRLASMKRMQVFLSPINKKTDDQLDYDFWELTSGASADCDSLLVQGRTLTLPKVAYGVAMTDFDSLCNRALGAADYLAVAARYHTLILRGIPKLGPGNRDQAKRFVTLIDALYEAGTNLICSAAAPPETLYPTGDGAFEFERTVSRLMEMQAESYIAARHKDEESANESAD